MVVQGPEGAGGVVVGVQVDAERTAPGGVQARVVDLVEEVLEGAGEIPEVDRASEQVAIGLQHLDGARPMRAGRTTTSTP